LKNIEDEEPMCPICYGDLDKDPTENLTRTIVEVDEGDNNDDEMNLTRTLLMKRKRKIKV